jgi:hypothetical protein
VNLNVDLQYFPLVQINGNNNLSTQEIEIRTPCTPNKAKHHLSLWYKVVAATVTWICTVNLFSPYASAEVPITNCFCNSLGKIIANSYDSLCLRTSKTLVLKIIALVNHILC